MVICLDVSHPESVALLLMADQAEKEVCARVKLLAAERLAGQARQAAIAKVVEDCQVQAALYHGISCMLCCLKHSIHSLVHLFVHSYVQYMSFPRDMNVHSRVYPCITVILLPFCFQSALLEICIIHLLRPSCHFL